MYKRTLLDEIRYYCFYIWWNWLDMLPRRIYWFFQRGKRGYADCDIWNFDDYLIDVISHGLRHLKQHKEGIPPEIWKKYDKVNDLCLEDKELGASEEWNQILDKIIEGFDSAEVMLEFGYELEHEEYMECERIRREGFDLFKEYFFNLWD
jgi:hypothetical protein